MWEINPKTHFLPPPVVYSLLVGQTYFKLPIRNASVFPNERSIFKYFVLYALAHASVLPIREITWSVVTIGVVISTGSPPLVSSLRVN